MKNRPAAIIIGVVAVAFVVGAVVFGVNQARQSSNRTALRERGIEVPVEQRTFFEQDTRRRNPNTGRRETFSDDQVLFSFKDADGEEVVVAQPIAEDRYEDLGSIATLTAVYLAEAPQDAELLNDGDFVANTVPYWLFALVCGACAVGSGVSAFLSTRPKRSA